MPQTLKAKMLPRQTRIRWARVNPDTGFSSPSNGETGTITGTGEDQFGPYYVVKMDSLPGCPVSPVRPTWIEPV